MLLDTLQKLTINQPLDEADRQILIRACKHLIRFYNDLEPKLLAGYVEKDFQWIKEVDQLIQQDRGF